MTQPIARPFAIRRFRSQRLPFRRIRFAPAARGSYRASATKRAVLRAARARL